MDLEKKLREALCGGHDIPCRTRRLRGRDHLLNEMTSSILPLLTPTEEKPFCPIPNVRHLRKILHLLEQYRSFKDEAYMLLDRVLQQNTLSYLLKICYYWWIEDLDILETILSYYYIFHGNYFEVIRGIISDHGTWACLFRPGIWLRTVRGNCIKYGDNSPLSYCLEYYRPNHGRFVTYGAGFANEMFFILNEHGPKFVSLSYESFRLAMPIQLLLLLQYGGTFSGVEIRGTEAEVCLDLVKGTLGLLRYDFGTLVAISPDVISSILNRGFWQNKLLCLRYMLRVMPQLKVERTSGTYDDDIAISRLLETYHPMYFPDFVKRLTDPCTLKHLCRLRVRARDMVCKMTCPRLPHGIESLNLPRHLINYLNLLED